jgi:3-oxoacyl-[acyl-carrier-protein] synthase-3
MVDTTDEWITKRTGIKTRHIAKDQDCSDIGVEAAKKAIERASIDKKDIDLIICATISPDYLCMPSTASVIGDKLGLNGIPAFDISAACSGFIYLLSIAKAFIESRTYKNILIIGSEKLSSIVDYEDRATCVLFGDGAGAAIIGSTEDKQKSILDVNIASDGKYWDFLVTPGGGSKNPASIEMLERRDNFIKMRGNETFKLAVKTLSNDVKEILEKNSIAPNEVDYFIPHQANYRIIKAVGDLLDFDEKQIVLTVQKYGNTSSASIPMAIEDSYNQGKLKGGELLLLDAFGGGLTWGSSLLYFNP